MEKSLFGIPTQVHHCLPGLTLYQCRHLGGFFPSLGLIVSWLLAVTKSITFKYLSHIHVLTEEAGLADKLLLQHVYTCVRLLHPQHQAMIGNDNLITKFLIQIHAISLFSN